MGIPTKMYVCWQVTSLFRCEWIRLSWFTLNLSENVYFLKELNNNGSIGGRNATDMEITYAGFMVS